MIRPVVHILATAMACSLFYERAAGQPSSPFENLSIDRPDVSNLPMTVRPGHFQIETGVEYNAGLNTNEFSLPNLVFRTGLTSKSELRVGFNRLYSNPVNGGIGNESVLVFVSGKYRFLEERGWRPAVAVQPEFSLPFHEAASYRDPDYSLASYSIILLFNNTLHEQVFINYNAGVIWGKREVDWLLSVSASFLHTHRLGYFLELFTLAGTSRFPLSFDGGLMFLAAPRLQFDVYAGHQRPAENIAWYGGMGVGFRLDRGDLKRKTFGEIGIHH